ncbi:MAG: tyrosine-type recombinase/integrase [Phycisphaerales bacterium]|nr:tyrosine-type recombinase/integrase [Phycisphaerales bacterium]
MPRRATAGPALPRIPKLGLHKVTGLRRARFNGRDIYFGREGDAEGNRRYKRMVAEFLANDGSLPLGQSERKELSIKELMARYWIAAKRSLQPDSLDPIKRPLKVLRRLYGDTLVEQFGPSQLRALRIEMDRMKWSRNGINEATRRIRTVFGWGVGEELVEPSVHMRLRGVRALRSGEGGRETKRVMPVAPELVEKTIPYLPHDVRAMVQLQMLTGARPGELRSLRWSEIDTSGEIWQYRPLHHKTKHHNRERTVRFGPRAQAILTAFKDRNPDQPLFSPAQSEAARHAAMRAARKTPVQPSQVLRAKTTAKSAAKRKRAPGTMYTRKSYRKSVARACVKAGVQHWHPHQLRHTFADFATRTDSLDLASTLLDHSSLRTTLAYTDTDTRRANDFARTYG